MKRLGANRLLIAVGLALALPATATARSPSADWRPQRPDRLAALDAAMAPVLARFEPALEAVQQDITVITGMVLFEGMEASLADMEARVEAAKRLPEDVMALQRLAAEGLAVLDAAGPPDPCFAQYHAVLTVGWMALGDSSQSVQASDMAAANTEIGAAGWLLLTYGQRVWAIAKKECAA